MKIVINKCYGGFSLSYPAVMNYAKRKGLTIRGYVNPRKPEGGTNFSRYELYDGESGASCIHYTTGELDEKGEIPNEAYFSDRDIPRDDPHLVAVVEEMGGDTAGGMCASLRVVEIPDGVKWEISEYDGMETIHEQHQSWT